ncbi:MAG: phenylalanine--tRNA ligase subunit beta [Gemmatimonadetes bacterium]|nr:phenylalanine--tRNA ligase subunit beta [Gemmatimonadota bacterium]
MHVSYRWLRALAPALDLEVGEVVDRLATYGAPVDEVVWLGKGLADILVARVETVRPHPNADRLTLCDVETGSGAVQVVCGAPNVRAGAYYPYVPTGSTLPNGVKIRRAKIRGVESVGMLCSEAELGLGRDHTGILELRGEFQPGSRFAEAVGLDDYRLVVDVTPNRPDLLSHAGIARELAPGGTAGLTLPEFPGSDAVSFAMVARVGAETSGAADGVRVEIWDPDLCPRYMAAVIRGVRIAPSPEWLAMRLRAVGARPINNVVDATNYVLFEVGQPLHAFDLNRLAGPAIVVRRARAGEWVVTLDGQLRSLGPEMLAICDAERPVAVAGVMGGTESEVSDETTDVLIECALFEPKSVRATARALSLATDASYRFERGVDPEGPPAALRRVAELIVATAGGTPAPAAVDVYPRPKPCPTIDLRPERVSHLLGIPFDEATIRAQLEPLGFAVDRGGAALRVRVPAFRSYDVTREIDLIEEVARRYGYEHFPDELRPFRAGGVPDDPRLQLEDDVRRVLVSSGLLEARTPAFTSERHGAVRLANPLSADESYLRSALLPGLLRRVEYNFARGVRDVRLFEIGTVFRPGPAGAQPVERTNVAVVLTGLRSPRHWSGPAAAVDTWDVKALVLRLLAPARLHDAEVTPAAPQDRLLKAAQGFTVRADKDVVGAAGLIRSDAVDAPAWAGDIWGIELVLPAEPPPPPTPRLRALATFPAVERDLAVVVPDEISAARVSEVMRQEGGALLEELSIFDVYRGPNIPESARSLAFRLRFRAADRTLTDDDAQRATEKIVSRLKEELGVEARR